MSVLFKSLAELLESVASTRSRQRTTALIADFLRLVEPKEMEPAVSLIIGRAFPKWSGKTLEVSWATLSNVLRQVTGIYWEDFDEAFKKTGDVGSAAREVYENRGMQRQTVLFHKPLTVLDVRRSLEAIADTEGSGSREKKERLIAGLLSQAFPLEVKYLVRIFLGEMRTGFSEGLMEQAVAEAFNVHVEVVRRASMVLGDIGEVAFIAKTEGSNGLESVSFKVFRPVKLMLAQVSKGVSEALVEHGGETAFEFKYDGARVQIHKLNDRIMIYSRRLTDVTESLPEISKLVADQVPNKEAILEGEVVAVDKAGAPIPFQHLMRRFRRIRGVKETAEQIPLKLYLFDVLFVDDESVVKLPYLSRRKILWEIAGNISLSTQMVTSDASEGEHFLAAAMSAGHEGLMAKKLDSPYTPGTRGKKWLKVKPVLEPLDLVITAAEYGYGRRHGWLSDYYLAARDESSGEFLNVGKTFKGLTDAEIVGMTERLKALAVKEDGHRVSLLPKVVVEVAYNEIQRSPKYRSGMALRFARITRIRDDKSAEEADTIQRVRTIYERQFAKKGRYKSQ
jgi:DNA ligase-1